MNPIELIKSGVETGDWKKICKAYKSLTGSEIKPKTKEDCSLLDVVKDRLDDSDLQLLLKLIYKLVSVDTTTLVKTPKKRQGSDLRLPKAKVDTPKTVVKKSRAGFNTIPTTEEGHSNKFDSAEEEQEFNRKKAEGTRVKKNEVRRKRPKKHIVECGGCGNDFESKIPSGEIGQRCQKCLKSLPRTRA